MPQFADGCLQRSNLGHGREEPLEWHAARSSRPDHASQRATSLPFGRAIRHSPGAAALLLVGEEVEQRVPETTRLFKGRQVSRVRQHRQASAADVGGQSSGG